jgi:hypothetical protein
VAPAPIKNARLRHPESSANSAGNTAPS